MTCFPRFASRPTGRFRSSELTFPKYIGDAAGISTNAPVAVKEGTDISDTEDVESSIQKELESMKPSASSSAFTFVKLDIQCGWYFHDVHRPRRHRLESPGLHTSVSFVKTGDGIDPVSLVHTICKDAHSKPDQKRSRFIKRMTPMTVMRKTMGGGLEHACQSVLRPHFHAGGSAKKVSKNWSIPPSVSAIFSDKLRRSVWIFTDWFPTWRPISKAVCDRLTHGYPSMLSAQRFETTTISAEMRSSRLSLLLWDQSTLLI